MHTYDVVVIGAGAAGLTAAQQLLQANVQNILVLEAQPYAGGRIHAYHDWGLPVETGAEFIYGSNTVAAHIARELGLEMMPVHQDRKLVDTNGAVLSHEARQLYYSLLEYIAAHGRRGASVAAIITENTITKDPVICQLVSQTIADREAGDAAALDSGAYTATARETVYNGQALVLRDGYQRIVQHLSQDVPVRFQCVVRSVDYSDEGRVGIMLEDGETITAGKVIIAVPLGVLQRGRISFTPALPEEKQAAIAVLGMGTAMKVLLRFKEPHDVVSLFHYGDGSNESLQTISSWWASGSDPRVLVGYAGGSRAAAALSLPAGRLNEKVIADLSAVFGKPLAGQIIGHEVVRWDTDPCFYGAYSNYPVGATPHDRLALAAPIGHRLFWAGEATAADGNYATVHGAILSGYRVADEVLKAYEH